MSILVTGGCGFIGTNLVRALVDAGQQVRVLDDESVASRATLGGMPVEFLSGSVTDRQTVRGALEGVESVIHLAARSSVIGSIENPRDDFHVNVIGTLALLEEMRAAGVRRIVAASTGGAILGEAPCPVHEDIAPAPLSPYGASKLAAEGYLSAYAGSYGFAATALRFSNVYGPHSLHKGSVVHRFLRDVLAGNRLTVFGDGSQVRDYVYVDDIVRGILAALEARSVGTFQLGTAIPTTMLQLIATLREVVDGGKALQILHADRRAGEIHTTFCDIAKARAAFGYAAPTTLREGLARTWDWYRAHLPDMRIDEHPSRARLDS